MEFLSLFAYLFFFLLSILIIGVLLAKVIETAFLFINSN